MSNYALPKSHQDLMEKSLVDTDNEVAQIMVRTRDPASARVHPSHRLRERHIARRLRCAWLAHVEQVL
ncbi:hypothetical protein OPT61_g7018 [Boeremia exigua]|uniref:Uncharacterized protein n=1 Tax=Boeremia exigua TaxID=749465 RepID=A0ACC2I5H7_9PLEO|nr:hypothetical protein OPT61_g7018 [Boeremia exigua]